MQRLRLASRAAVRAVATRRLQADALNSCSLLPDPITPTELNHSPHTEPSSAPMRAAPSAC